MSSNALGEFLRARRASTRPESVGLPSGGRRRVPGLRRDEVAVFANMSTDYYVRLEQGRERNPSDEILVALARVFGLDGDGLDHLRRLAETRHRLSDAEHVSAGTRRLLELWRDTPALVQNSCGEVLAYNRLAGAIHPSLTRDRNLLRAFFLDPEERALFPRWEESARIAVAWLRASADPNSTSLAALVGELTLKSRDLARLWANHDVRAKATGRKAFHHPIVGAFTVDYETFRLEDGSGRRRTGATNGRRL